MPPNIILNLIEKKITNEGENDRIGAKRTARPWTVQEPGRKKRRGGGS